MKTATATNDSLLTGYLVSAALAGTGIVAMWIAGAVSLPLALACHAALTGGFWMLPRMRRDGDVTRLVVLSVLVMGPLGAIGSLYLARAARRAETAPAIVGNGGRNSESPAARDAATALHTPLVEGRAYVPRSAQPTSFLTVLTESGLWERQAMLGTISQHYHADHFPVLKSALTSQDAPLRVSAAAVYAKLKSDCRRSSIAASWPEDREPSDRELARRARMLADAARSSLLDRAETEEARAQAIDMLLRLRPAATVPDETEARLCGLLLDAARHDEIEARLAGAGPTLPPTLRRILQNARMRSRRYGALCEIVCPPDAGNVEEFPRRRRGKPEPLLLAAPARSD